MWVLSEGIGGSVILIILSLMCNENKSKAKVKLEINIFLHFPCNQFMIEFKLKLQYGKTFCIISSTAFKEQVFFHTLLKCAALPRSMLHLDAVQQTAVCQTFMSECTVMRKSTW